MTRQRLAFIGQIAVAVSALALSLYAPPLLLWNASASAPVGLYLLHRLDSPRIGDLVTVLPPAPLARYLAARGYLPVGVPLLKRIAALPGQTVCRARRSVTVDGDAVAEALDRDHLGRPLPTWQGCRTLRAGEVFVLNPHSRSSFDGRYFGPLPRASIARRATPLWTEIPR